MGLGRRGRSAARNRRARREHGRTPPASAPYLASIVLDTCEHCRTQLLFCSIPAFLSDSSEPEEDRATIRRMWEVQHDRNPRSVVMWCPGCDVFGVISEGVLDVR